MCLVYNNFIKKFGSKQLKTLMWKAATGTHPKARERQMHNIKEVNEEAFKYLIAIPPRLVIDIHCYIKSHFLLTTKKFVSPDIGLGLGYHASQV